jgi:hypothetical protein
MYDVYETGAWIVGVITFLGCWMYCIASYGFLFGVGLGWLPSAIVAGIVAFLWPLVVGGLILLLVLVFAQ